MKSVNHFTILLIIITFTCNTVFAVPADKTQVFSKKISNGKIISYTLNGDEFISWATSLDGYTLLSNNNGELVYAIKNDSGHLVKSNVLACDLQYRTIEDNIFLSTVKKGLYFNSTQIAQFEQNRAERYSDNSRENTPTTGTPNFLVILVSYTDVTFSPTNAITMQNQISQSNYTSSGATGSVRDYFYDNSMGALNANFTVVGPYTLSHNRAYYGAQTATDNDTLPREMVAEACALANPDVNFANFDNDNDGIVDMVHVVYAGLGEHNGGGANAIWAHSWVFPSNTVFDGVTLSRYSCSNELRTVSSVDGIGVVCHEMGHVLGLPDFYDTDYSGSGGQSIHLAQWDLMASGNYNNYSRTPPYLSGLERQILGWFTPINLSETNTYCTLPAISDSNKAYKVVLSENEFLMFEHRNRKKWDAYTPSKGMLVFHGDNTLINAWLTSRANNINDNPANRGYYIVPASGDSTNIYSSSTPYPGSTNQTNFVNSNLKNGTPTGKTLTGIAYGADSVIHFTFMNSSPIITILPPTFVTTSTATINATVTGSDIISMGFEYRTTGAPNFTQQVMTSNPLQLTLNNLTINTIYEYRVYVVTSFGTVYSPIETFATDCGININAPFTEGFESTFACWNQTSADTNHINVVYSGSNPTCPPHGGIKMLKYNSYQITANRWAALYTPKINFPSNYNYNASLWIYRTNGNFSDPQEGVEIYLNSTQSLNSATLIGYISNDRTATPSISSNGWYNYTCSLPANISGDYYLIFKTISQYGYSIYIDDISVTQTPIATPVIIYDSTSNITQNSATFNSSFAPGAQTILNSGFKYKNLIDANWNVLQSSNNVSPLTAYVNNLNPNSTYLVKSYMTTQTNNYESATDTFTTLPVILPVVSTDSVSTNSDFSAILFGSFTQGTYPVLTSGFQYKLTSTSTWTTINQPANNNTFNNTIYNLTPNTNYQFQAFVTDINGTYYGEMKSFTTPVSLGEVNTMTYQYITYDSIRLLGEIINTGYTDSIEIGFVLSPNSNPLIGDSSTQKFTATYVPNTPNFSVLIENPCNNFTTYYFKAFIENRAGLSYGDEIMISCLSINETEELNSINVKLYPNPTNYKSNLKIENVYGNIMIRITDISGRVLQKIEENVNNGYETQIDLSNYSKGVYFINIITDNTQKTEKLILK